MSGAPPARGTALPRALVLPVGAASRPTEALLAEGDIVIAAATGGPRMLSAGTMAAALRQRRRRPGLRDRRGDPADVEPAVNDLDGAFLYTLDDLERAAIAGRRRARPRRREARAMLEAELAAFQRAAGGARGGAGGDGAAQPFRGGARRRCCATSRGLDAEAATRLLVNRLLHAPSEVLRGLAASEGDAAEVEALARRLFRLDRDEGDEGP